MTLFEKMGFKENPFSKFSAEEEVAYLEKIYVPPKYISTILNDIEGNNSRFIFGERGNGKSALMFDLIDSLREKKALVIMIDDYQFLMSSGNHLILRYLREISEKLIKEITREMILKEIKISSFEIVEREKLAFLIKNFFRTSSKKEFENFGGLTPSEKAYNVAFANILNRLIGGAVTITSDLISKAFGLPVIEEKNIYREYLPLIKKTTSEIDFTKITENELFNLLGDALEIANLIGFKNIVFFFDKVDEEREIAGKIKEETDILEPILLSNKILLDRRYSMTFLLWSKLKSEIENRGVRLDKIGHVNVNWNNTEILEIIEKRISYFSDGSASFIKLFQSPDDVDLILSLANKSPRDLIILMNKIYTQQEQINPNLGLFSRISVNQGINEFLIHYNFKAKYPTQEGSKQDIRTTILRLKKIGKSDFKIKDISNVYKIEDNKSRNYARIMKNLGVVSEKEDTLGTEKEYVICDPKIKFVVEKGLDLS